MSFEYPKHVCFRCARCPICCGDTEEKVRSILLLKVEAKRIAKKTLMNFGEFAEEIEGSEPYVYRMKKTAEGKCVFLKDNSCSIYKIRPIICRFYPFQLNDRRGNYAFTYTDECPGIGNGHELQRKHFERLFNKLVELMEKNKDNDQKHTVKQV